MIVLDGRSRGVELAFWESEVWTQGDGPPFRRSERCPIDIKDKDLDLELRLQRGKSTLLLDGRTILSGRLFAFVLMLFQVRRVKTLGDAFVRSFAMYTGIASLASLIVLRLSR